MNEPSRSEADPGSHLDLPSVLLVDDDPAVLESMTAVLTDSAAVTSCSSAERALARMSKQAFDIVVADYGLPLMNGAELLKRALERRPGCATILITGSEDSYAIGKRQGCYVLLKPVDPARLVSTIKRLALLARMKQTVQDTQSSVARNRGAK